MALGYRNYYSALITVHNATVNAALSLLFSNQRQLVTILSKFNVEDFLSDVNLIESYRCFERLIT